MADGERAKFSLGDGQIEIEGSETFVAAQLERLAPILEKMFQEPKPLAQAHPAPATAVHQSASAATGKSLQEYLHVYAADAAGKLKILTSLPGDGKAGKTISAGLLLTFGNEVNGQKLTTVDEVRALCNEHACYDQSNFSQTLKKGTARGYFTFTGSGSNQSIALTHPGRLKAKELANSLNK